MARIANWASPAQVAAFKRQLQPGVTGKERWAPYASKLEHDYALELEQQRQAGKIRLWQYEPAGSKLRLGHRCFYQPDFRIVDTFGAVEYHEVKGWMREDARVKLYAAASRYPERFFLVRQVRGAWRVTLVPKEPT